MSGALAALREAYDARLTSARLADAPVVACVGMDVPRELIIAAGMRPVRLAGDPERATPDGDRYLAGVVDADTRAQFQMLVDGAYGPIHHLVIAHDSESLPRLYYALRALRMRRGIDRVHYPAPHFFDMLHMPHYSTGLYNRTRAQQLREALASWSGKPVTDAAIHAGVRLCNENRRLLHQVRALRIAAQPRLSGADALKVIASAAFTDTAKHNQMLSALLAEAQTLSPLTGRRIFLTGSSHDHCAFYQAIESAGAVIVGEDHDWGDRSYDALVDEHAPEPIDAIVDRYQYGAPAAAKYSIAVRAAYTARRARETGAQAVICFIRATDPAPRWDVPDQRRALGDMPFLLLDDRPYKLSDPAVLRDEVATFLAAAPGMRDSAA